MNELSAEGMGHHRLFASHVLHLVIKRIIISYGKQSRSFSYFSHMRAFAHRGEHFPAQNSQTQRTRAFLHAF